LEIEFKRELDLGSSEGKSKLAQEICALYNFGGGWIVLGREDDGTYPSKLPQVIEGINQDTINNIASAYISPSPHCALRRVRPMNADYSVPVIKVPSIGVSPACGKKNGPQDDKGRIVGIRQGVHYTRTAGPKSAPIESPEQWPEVIRRCILTDSASLLSALKAMMESPKQVEGESSSGLQSDIDLIVGLWSDKGEKVKGQVSLPVNFILFAFEIVGSRDAYTYTTENVSRFLSQRNKSRNGPHVFFDESGWNSARPYYFENAGVAGLQAEDIAAEGNLPKDLASIWRINEAGCGVEVVSYWEDSEHLELAVRGRSSRQWERGTNLWIAIQMAYIGDFLGFVFDFATEFFEADRVRILARYEGLLGRVLNSPRIGSGYSMTYKSQQRSKIVDLIFQLSAISPEARSSAVAAILQPINQLFQGPEIGSDTVIRSMAALRNG
jgi:hypothetical protein